MAGSRIRRNERIRTVQAAIDRAMDGRGLKRFDVVKRAGKGGSFYNVLRGATVRRMQLIFDVLGIELVVLARPRRWAQQPKEGTSNGE